MSVQIHHMTWEGIEIELTYDPAAWGGEIAHLEVRSINPEHAPLPITQTGYRSHFHAIGTLEETEGSLIEQVTAWLNEEAKSDKWQNYLEDSRQLSLF
ncbi:hypothetical protein [uncultured Roseobacter sp.]|uniref:hypothetical protein n=1 Tax=uncultured Roseobacter sp. TaxID=114847 RepID=UPI0026080CE7|nr:hypothetical protein [uncultured Roseobacter sp.]